MLVTHFTHFIFHPNRKPQPSRDVIWPISGPRRERYDTYGFSNKLGAHSLVLSGIADSNADSLLLLETPTLPATSPDISPFFKDRWGNGATRRNQRAVTGTSTHFNTLGRYLVSWHTCRLNDTGINSVQWSTNERRVCHRFTDCQPQMRPETLEGKMPRFVLLMMLGTAEEATWYSCRRLRSRQFSVSGVKVVARKSPRHEYWMQAHEDKRDVSYSWESRCCQ